MIAAEPRNEPAAWIESKSAGRVDLVRREHRDRRAARDHRFQLAAARDASADVVDELAQRRAERELVVPGPLDVPGDGVDDGAGRSLGAELRVPGAALLDDDRDRGQGLDVVDQRRRGVQPRDRRERRPRPRLAAVTLERLEQRGLLAADVRAGAAMEDERDVAEQLRVAHLVGSSLQHLVLGRVLASDVDEDVLRPDRVRRDQAPLDEPVRNPAHDLPVLERPRLGLVGVGNDVRRLARHLRRLDEAELAPHRKACAAPPAEGRRRDLLDHLLAGQPTRLLERCVTADRPVLGELRQVAVVGAREDESLGLSHRSAPRRSPARPRAGSARGTGGRSRPRAHSRSRRRTRSCAA